MLTQHEISWREHCDWFERNASDPTRRLLIIEERHEALGFVQLKGVGAGAISEWGFLAAPDKPKGTGRKFGKAAIDYAFRSLQIHKLCGQVLGTNESSIRFHLSLGFRKEGVLRQHHRIEARYHDLICFGLLCEEWLIASDDERHA